MSFASPSGRLPRESADRMSKARSDGYGLDAANDRLLDALARFGLNGPVFTRDGVGSSGTPN